MRVGWAGGVRREGEREGVNEGGRGTEGGEGREEGWKG